MGLVARDVMQPAVRTVPPDMSLIDLEREFCDAGDSGFPVVSGEGRLIGVVSRTDIVRKLAVEQSYAEYESDYYRELSEFGPSGAASSGDVAAEVGRRVDTLCVRDVMSESPITVQGTTPLADLARTLVDRKIHRVPVVDASALIGIVTTMDLVRALAEGKLS